MFRKKRLEILLESLETHPSPDVTREQYSTPATIAAELLHFAFMQGDLNGTVYDLGCGTGILAIGAKLLGAKKVLGFDSDGVAIKIARKNARGVGVSVKFVESEVKKISGKADAVIMNPPFGAQHRHADRAFLKKAFELADVVYSIHNAGSREFIKKFISPCVITHCIPVPFVLKRTFHFHKKDMVVRRVELYRMERKR